MNTSKKKDLNITSNDLKKIKKKMDYRGCKNCIYQIAPLRMCKWAEQGGDGRLHLICPKWEHE